MIDALNTLSTNQWALLTMAAMLVLTVLLIWAIWPSRDEWDAPVAASLLLLGIAGGALLLGIVWGTAGLIDLIVWMWQN